MDNATHSLPYLHMFVNMYTKVALYVAPFKTDHVLPPLTNLYMKSVFY